MTDALPLAKKSLGQHWLTDKPTLKLICSYAEISKSDVVLEIGSGQGSLTEILVNLAKSVIAIELDDNLAQLLPSIVKSDNLEVVNQSILEYDLGKLSPDYKIVANIPYYITSKLIRNLSESSNPPKLAVILVQKEVAQRVAAQPGAMSILSVSAQFYWDVELKEVVPRNLFTPPPKVDSQILLLNRRDTLLFDVDTDQFFQLVKSGFSSRRKTLVNSLSGGMRVSKPSVMEIIESINLDPLIRPQMLSMDNWFDLYKAINFKN